MMPPNEPQVEVKLVIPNAKEHSEDVSEAISAVHALQKEFGVGIFQEALLNNDKDTDITTLRLVLTRRKTNGTVVPDAALSSALRLAITSHFPEASRERLAGYFAGAVPKDDPTIK